jgi:hypothetical protein
VPALAVDLDARVAEALAPFLAESEFDLSPTIWVTLAVCVLVPALVGRFWTLLLPVALLMGVLLAGLSDGFYSRVSEDIQAGIFFGAVLGLVLGSLVLLVRHLIALRRTKRRRTQRGSSVAL